MLDQYSKQNYGELVPEWSGLASTSIEHTLHPSTRFGAFFTVGVVHSGLFSEYDNGDIEGDSDETHHFHDAHPGSYATGSLRKSSATVLTHAIELNLNLEEVGAHRKERCEGEHLTKEDDESKLDHGLVVVEYQHFFPLGHHVLSFTVLEDSESFVQFVVFIQHSLGDLCIIFIVDLSHFSASNPAELEVLEDVDSNLLSSKLDNQIQSQTSEVTVPESQQEIGQVAIEELEDVVELRNVVFILVEVPVILQIYKIEDRLFEYLFISDHQGSCNKRRQEPFNFHS